MFSEAIWCRITKGLINIWLVIDKSNCLIFPLILGLSMSAFKKTICFQVVSTETLQQRFWILKWKLKGGGGERSLPAGKLGLGLHCR